MVRPMVPVAFVAEKLGHKVEWNSKKQQVVIDSKITLTINSKSVKTPNGTVTMDTVPFVKEGRTFVPIRFVSECLGYTVNYKYVAGENCVLITGKSSGASNGINNGNQSTGSKYAAQSYDWSDYQGTLISKYYVSASKIGANSNNNVTRQTGTSWEEERSYFNNKLLYKSGWGLAKDGQMALGTTESIKNETIGGSKTPVAIFEISNGSKRHVVIRGWVYSTTTNASEMAVVGQNTVIEALKYYSNSVQDGLAIYEFVNKCFNTYTDPTYNEPMTFGSTKVVFRNHSSFGLSVEFDAK